ncbi:hypothetical protein PR003_g21930 [Phytophthora rubi]|uniref:Uncharacterized protein n=1 Tax=Phytophthora rubi TaxID=129364 RepID=A0A6A3MXA7_9STRA|nr:hypothetical protein PR002_g20912 [Phytophthora rubi]KAE9033437.1 hypothetical protein PR001_g10164 [Phytophthora rubi]KAE9303725.1 hypothetical protein PR003_g21930 [Phytophthora rubi]
MQLSRGSVIQMLETYAYQLTSISNRSPAMNQDVQAVLDFIDMLQQPPSEDGRIDSFRANFEARYGYHL